MNRYKYVCVGVNQNPIQKNNHDRDLIGSAQNATKKCHMSEFSNLATPKVPEMNSPKYHIS